MKSLSLSLLFCSVACANHIDIPLHDSPIQVFDNGGFRVRNETTRRWELQPSVSGLVDSNTGEIVYMGTDGQSMIFDHLDMMDPSERNCLSSMCLYQTADGRTMPNPGAIMIMYGTAMNTPDALPQWFNYQAWFPDAPRIMIGGTFNRPPITEAIAVPEPSFTGSMTILMACVGMLTARRLL